MEILVQKLAPEWVPNEQRPEWSPCCFSRVCWDISGDRKYITCNCFPKTKEVCAKT